MIVLFDNAVQNVSLLFPVTAVVDVVVSSCVHDNDIDDGDRDDHEDANAKVMLMVMVILWSFIVLNDMVWLCLPTYLHFPSSVELTGLDRCSFEMARMPLRRFCAVSCPAFQIRLAEDSPQHFH